MNFCGCGIRNGNNSCWWRWSKRDSALEEGWLLAELKQRFNYSVEELARRFDRSVRWVADRLALVELLPESVQQPVRRGAISAHVAMKFLVPVARSRPEDCQRLAEAFAAHHSTCLWRIATGTDCTGNRAV